MKLKIIDCNSVGILKKLLDSFDPATEIFDIMYIKFNLYYTSIFQPFGLTEDDVLRLDRMVYRDARVLLDMFDHKDCSAKND